VRAALTGIFYVDEIICGFPCSTWIALAEETYSISRGGYQFNGWPDGKSLIEQEQCVVEILKIVLMEILRAAQDVKKQN
jgi:hypothetical protein